MTIISQDTIKRTLKTVGAVAAALVASRAVAKPPTTDTSAVIAAGSGVATLALNMAIDWFTNTKNARLDKLAAAIDAAVDARLAKQGVVDVEPTQIPAV